MKSSIFNKLQAFLKPRLNRTGNGPEASNRGGRSRFSTDHKGQGLRWGDEENLPAGKGSQWHVYPVSQLRSLVKMRAGLRSAGRTLLFLAPVFIALLAVLAYFVAQSKQTEQADPSPVELPDPLGNLPQTVRSELTAPETKLPAVLKLTFTGNPVDLCSELAAVGMENSGWKRAPFTRSRWQCASDLVRLTTPSVDYGPATLFFVLRGPDAAHIDHLRLKLNVEDPAQLEIGQEAARLVIGELSKRYAWAVPEKFLQAIANFEALEMMDRGVRLSVAPEDPNLTGDPTARQRLNIVLDFGEPDLIRPADHFEKKPPFTRGRPKAPAGQAAE